MSELQEGLARLEALADATKPRYEQLATTLSLVAYQIALRIGQSGGSYLLLPRGYGVMHADPLQRQGDFLLLKWEETKLESITCLYTGHWPNLDQWCAFSEDLSTGLLEDIFAFLQGIQIQTESAHAQVVWLLPANPKHIEGFDALQNLVGRSAEESPKPSLPPYPPLNWGKK